MPLGGSHVDGVSYVFRCLRSGHGFAARASRDRVRFGDAPEGRLLFALQRGLRARHDRGKALVDVGPDGASPAHVGFLTVSTPLRGPANRVGDSARPPIIVGPNPTNVG